MLSAKAIIESHAAEFGLPAFEQVALLCEFIDGQGDRVLLEALQAFVDTKAE